MRAIDADKIVYSWQIDADGQEHDGVTLQSIIDKMPTIEPERKTGRWIYDEERCATGIYAICSACDESIYQTGNFRYCPNCGARMMEGEG